MIKFFVYNVNYTYPSIVYEPSVKVKDNIEIYVTYNNLKHETYFSFFFMLEGT